MKKILCLWAGLGGLWLGACQSGPRLLCSDVEFENGKFRVSDSEKKLLCGDPKDPSWREIPRPQKIFSVKNFLLERGYYAPVIEERPEKIVVHLGPKSRLKILDIEGWPADLKPYLKRRFLTRLLKPAMLSEMQSDLLQELKSQGYACATLDISAYAPESRVEVKINSGPRHLFGKVDRDQVAQIKQNLFDRFEAYSADEIYDYRLTELTESRVRTSGLVQDIALLPHCSNDKATFQISQKTFSGRPRFISVGAGFDTEEFLITKGRLAFYRLGRNGSSLQTKLSASVKVQKIDNIGLIDFLPPEYRWGAYLALRGKREDESKYELISASLGTGLRKAHDYRNSNLEYRAGPLVEQLWIYRGPGLRNTHSLAFEGSAEWMTHNFEYHASNPSRGLKVNFEAKGTAEELSSTFSALRTQLELEGLMPIWEDARTEVIAGARGFYGTTFQVAGVDRGSRIPTEYRYFLGGSKDLRGFGRKELPRNSGGAFTAAYLGAELRAARLFLLEPLIFVDTGALGHDSLHLEPQYYLSPGFGFRYKSPFGSLRGTVAQSYTFHAESKEDKISHVQFFLSFGDEF